MISNEEQINFELFIKECRVSYSYIHELYKKFIEHQEIILKSSSQDFLKVIKSTDLLSSIENAMGSTLQIREDHYIEDRDKLTKSYRIGVKFLNDKFLKTKDQPYFYIDLSFLFNEGWSLEAGYFIDIEELPETTKLSILKAIKAIQEKYEDFDTEDYGKEGKIIDLKILKLELADLNSLTENDFVFVFDKHIEKIIKSIGPSVGKIDRKICEIMSPYEYK